MICHSSSLGRRIPGHIVRSVATNSLGTPITGTRTYRTDHNSPFEQRWGGWYVTGTHGDLSHRGNQYFRTRDELENRQTRKGSNIVDLKQHFDTSLYVSPHSDIVALLVLEHQTAMHNLLTSSNYQIRTELYNAQKLKDERGDESDELSNELSNETKFKIKQVADELVDYMLFIEETPLTSPIRGTTDFQREFSKRGPKDSRDRSLFMLDLETRLLKYPCSYLIYSKSFDGLPDPLKTEIARRMIEVLTSAKLAGPNAQFTPEDKKATLEILQETKPGLFK